MSPRDHGHGRGRRIAGFTLFEVLTALIIVVLITLTVMVLFRAVTAVRGKQRDLRRHGEAAMAALDRLAHDLTAACDDETEAFGFFLEAERIGSETCSRMRFSALVPDPYQTGVTWQNPKEIVYRVETGTVERPTLVRIDRLLSAPGARDAARTNELVRGVRRFLIDLPEDGGWPETATAAETTEWPRGVRVHLELEDEEPGEAYRTAIFLPLGDSVKPANAAGETDR